MVKGLLRCPQPRTVSSCGDRDNKHDDDNDGRSARKHRCHMRGKFHVSIYRHHRPILLVMTAKNPSAQATEMKRNVDCSTTHCKSAAMFTVSTACVFLAIFPADEFTASSLSPRDVANPLPVLAPAGHTWE